MNNGNTEIITRAMGRNGIDLMGISDTKWKEKGNIRITIQYILVETIKLKENGWNSYEQKYGLWVQSYK